MSEGLSIQTGANCNVAIIGAGPAGLIAAEKLAEAGFKVTVYDRMPSPARKLLIAGRGGLNLTHSEDLEKFTTRYGNAEEWLKPHINLFPPADLIKWCEGIGIETFIGSSGRVFPKAMKAVELLRAWLKKLEGYGVEYKPRHKWLGWEGNKLKFLNADNQEIYVSADATLLALGGASWPHLGSDGGWVDILKTEGIEVEDLRPSNCGFVANWSEYFSSRFAGQALKPVAITHNGICRQGEAMITEKGIEGGVIYAISARIRDEIERNGSAIIHLDLRPNMTEAELAKKLAAPRGSKSQSNYLKRLGFPALAINLLKETGAESFKSIPLKLTSTSGIERAISSAGGVKLDEITQELMLKKKTGVYIAGEMLDWEAQTGGYLLQACFSTGVAAAKAIKNKLLTK